MLTLARGCDNIVTARAAGELTSDWAAASAANNVWVGGLANSPAAITEIYR